MASSPGSLASVDGVLMLASEATIPATDEGLLRGDGVFEVIRLYDGQPFAFEEHLSRLGRSAANMRLPLDVEAVRAETWRLVAEAGSGSEHELLRIVITRGGHRLLLTEPAPAMPDQVRLATVTYSPTRVLDGVKSLSYGANMLASRLAREKGFDEALLVTPHGRVLEAPTSTIFWVADRELLTPPLEDHILASITRAMVIAATGAAERPCSLDELLRADEAFLASTAREVQPVAAIDGRSFDVPGPVTRRTTEAIESVIRERLAEPAR
ncbi:MAG TPA: aminotransferase class IV [Solirubrobacteraceae bacterium]|nr:aminotransferase class IV [Solirubrobacteraceae bacterium]